MIPSPEEFEERYRVENQSLYDSYSSDKYHYAIHNRVLRAYPSLVRDIMFALFLKEKLHNHKIIVIYNEELDRYEGIDIMICGKNNWGVHLFTKTKRGEEYRKKKNNRHKDDFTNVIDIDLEVDLDSKNTYGNIILYGEKDYNNLIEICRNHGRESE